MIAIILLCLFSGLCLGKVLLLPTLKSLLVGFCAAGMGLVYLGIAANLIGPSFLDYLGLLEAASITVIAFLIGYDFVCRHNQAGPVLLNMNGAQTALAAVVASLALALFYIAGFISVPAFGWDVFDQWAPAAGDYLTSDVAQASQWTWENYRSAHPATISALIAIAETDKQFLADITSAKLLWHIACSITLILVFLHTHIIGNNLVVSSLITFAASTIPLLENHAAIYGYAEIYLGLILISASLMLIHIAKKKTAALTVLLIATLALVSIKNIGAFLAVIMVFAYITVRVQWISEKYLKIIMLVAPCFAVLAVFCIDAAGVEMQITMRYRDLLIVQPENLYSIPRNEFFSLILNNSFSIFPLVFALSVIRFSFEKEINLSHQYIAVASWGLFLFIVASQLTYYGYVYAIPERDTGNTRFTLPVLIFGLLILPYFISIAQNSVRKLSLQPYSGGAVQR